MFSNDFCLSVIQDDKILKEENGVVKIGFDSEYVIRLRNKHRLVSAVDLYVDSILACSSGLIIVPGRGFIDIKGYITSNNEGRRFKFAHSSNKGIKQPNELENGIIEAKFYLQIDNTDYTHKEKELVYYPIYIYPRAPYQNPYPIYPAWCSNPGTIYTTCQINDSNSNNFVSMNRISGSSNGATVEGSVHNQSVNTSIPFDLTKDSISLKLKLMGYDIDPKKCYRCKNDISINDIFCRKCGKKLK